MNYHFAMPSSLRAKHRLALAFATVLGDMLLQTGDGHGHSNRQLPLLGRREAAEPNQAPHPVARLDELAFEPSMFRTTYRQGRDQTHRAPVENREKQSNIKAKKKQIVFSPYIRLGLIGKSRGITPIIGQVSALNHAVKRRDPDSAHTRGHASKFWDSWNQACSSKVAPARIHFA
ncbi:MAG TPA: hypothetical protein VNU23_11540 [Candidatus Cybelea sp.]|nr:hypothetical protein [Candidatus Cybelea sp.]